MANIFTNSIEEDVGTIAKTVYTANTGTNSSSTIIGMSLSNNQLTEITADIILVRASPSVSVHVIDNVPIPAGSSFIPIGGDLKLVLLPGDSLTVTSSAASSIDVIVSALEITQ